MAARELRQQAREEVRARADHRDIEPAPRNAAEAVHRLRGLAELLDDGAAVLQHLLAGLGQIDLAPELLEKPLPGVRLELLHLRGHRRLREVQLLRRAREAQVPRHALEDFQLAQCGVPHITPSLCYVSKTSTSPDRPTHVR